MSIASTAARTRHTTRQFIVMLRTLEDAVTHVVSVDTDWGVTAAVEPWTRVPVTPLLVLTAWAVIDRVTPDIHR